MQPSTKKRSDDAVALRRFESLVRKLPRCLRAPSNVASDMQDISLHVHQLAVGEHPGKKSGLALLLPEEVPVGAWSFSLLPPGHEQPILAKVKPATPGCPILLTSQQWEDLKVWTQLCLEIARCDRSCPLHQCFGQTMLTLWKDRSGKWLPAERTEVQSDKDLPERSFWLLAPLASADEESAKISWSCLSWALAALAQFRESSSWLSMPRTWLGKLDPALPELALDEAVVLGPMPTSSRGSDVKGLCIDLEVKAGEEGAAIFTGYKFSRAAVNAAIDPEFAKVHRNLQQERLELELKAEDCELMPLTSGALQVLRCLPSLLWRLEFVALMQEMPLLCDGLLQTALPSALGEAMTHSKVLSLPFQPSHPQWSKRFCYERMELMGDAVLKLMACTHAAAALPKASEGQLSSVAQWCETNKWLRQVNEKTIQVGSYLLLESFRPKERLSKLRQGRVPQKVAADAVEAAIGAVFGCAAGAISEAAEPLHPGASSLCLASGMDASWKIFRILVQQGPSTENESMDIKAAFAAPPCQTFQAAALAGLQTSLNLDAGTDAHAAEQVKNAFGYSFRNPKLLAALRASSTGARSVGFQRLEFLGDAVLLVCVCCHLMQVCSDFDEGQLSQALQAFICNKYLSRKLIRRFGEVRSFASVFFPRQTSPQRVHLPSQFDEVLASEVETDYVIGVRNVEAPGHKCVADGYEAMIAAVLLDTGGDLGETWAVFAKDFEVPSRAELLRPRPRHEDHLRLDGSEKEEQTAKSSGLDAAAAPEFGKPEGEGRRLLLDHCRRHGLKLRFEVKESGAVAEVRVRCVVGGRFLPEACGASMRQAQDLAAEAALWELTRRPTQSDAKFPPPSLPESLRPDLTDFPQVDFEQAQRPKGIARQELQRYCNRNGLQHRFVESEEEDVDHTVTHRMRVAAGDRIFPP
ncbi:dcl1, partial [Symbiodinium necroappetens]